MDLLLIGGGIFLGASLVDSALARGHRLTVFNRGRSRSDWPCGVEVIVGDRRSDLGAARRARRFDAVIDTCGYVPADAARERRRARVVRPLLLRLEHLGLRVVRARAGARERRARFQRRASPKTTPTAPATTGRRRRRASASSAAAFGERALIVRPGLIVGPGDRTGRFSYWPWRALAGGEILVPDVSGDDADPADRRPRPRRLDRARRRSAARAAPSTRPDRRTAGACGWPEVLEACIDAARRRGGAPLRFVPVGEAFLLEQGVAPWNELPLWVPSTDAGAPRLRPRRLQPRGRRRPRHAAARRDRRRGPRRVRHRSSTTTRAGAASSRRIASAS